MNCSPLISIQIINKNGGKFIHNALKSIFSQTFQDFEVLFVDDGSIDNSRHIVSDFLDSRLRAYFLPSQGIVATRQWALERSRGKWTAIFDSDDISFSDRLYTSFSKIDASTVAVGGQIQEIDEEGQILSNFRLYPTSEKEIKSRLGKKYSICHGTALFNTKIALQVGGYQTPLRGIGEDEFLFQRLGSQGKIINVEDILIQRRIHRDSICTQAFRTNWVLMNSRFSSQDLQESSYWARVGKSAMRGKNTQIAFTAYKKSLSCCPLKIDSLAGALLSNFFNFFDSLFSKLSFSKTKSLMLAPMVLIQHVLRNI